MLSHVFYQAPLGLEFANTKNRKGVILFRVVEGSTAKKIHCYEGECYVSK